jgi:hypothetical protein
MGSTPLRSLGANARKYRDYSGDHKNRKYAAVSRGFVAGGPGFEPGLTESESAVLPLNYPPPRSPQKALKSKDFGMPERSLGPVDILLFEADSPLLRNLIQG